MTATIGEPFRPRASTRTPAVRSRTAAVLDEGVVEPGDDRHHIATRATTAAS
ncbi:hypothetical protein ACR6C2_06595 [Streptomyces sp. INA 01156]